MEFCVYGIPSPDFLPCVEGGGCKGQMWVIAGAQLNFWESGRFGLEASRDRMESRMGLPSHPQPVFLQD